MKYNRSAAVLRKELHQSQISANSFECMEFGASFSQPKISNQTLTRSNESPEDDGGQTQFVVQIQTKKVGNRNGV